MQKIIQSQTHSKTQDMQRDYYLNQKKTLEINPRHPLIKELLRLDPSSLSFTLLYSFLLFPLLFLHYLLPPSLLASSSSSTGGWRTAPRTRPPRTWPP